MYAIEAFILSVVLSYISADPELPICPTNIQFLPQKLPMHCRMPRSADPTFPKNPDIPTMPPFVPPFYQSPPPDSQPPPIPVPVPGLPAFPGGMMPQMMPPMMPPPMIPPPAGPMHKLPVIVMPFYSPDPAFKKKGQGQKKKKGGGGQGIRARKETKRFFSDYSSDTDASSDTTDTDTDTTDTDTSSTSSDSSRERRWWRKGIGRSKNTRRMLKRRSSKKSKHKTSKKEYLTPILQYVTNEGYVIFEKKISKDEAKDWLGEKNGDANEIEDLNKGKNKDLSTEQGKGNRSKISNPAAPVKKSKKHHQKPPAASSKQRPPK